MTNQSASPEPGCVIREASSGDAKAIEALYRELVSDPLVCVLPDQLAAIAASATSFLMVVEVDGAVCATAQLTVCPDAMYRTQNFGLIENVVVAQSMRNRGLGRALLARLEQMAAAFDCTKVMLLSSAKRTTAHAFFRHCGFSGEAKNAFVKYRSDWAGLEDA
jgi:N-acetylglutamate synthase-like GNAT family acetyltransferase